MFSRRVLFAPLATYLIQIHSVTVAAAAAAAAAAACVRCALVITDDAERDHYY